MEQNSYKNFEVAVYCPVANLNDITDLEAFDRKFQRIMEHMHISKVYLEVYRGMEWITKEHMQKLKAYFEGKGIAVSGGVTTCDDAQGEGFLSLCYSSEKGIEIVKKAFALAAELFDEIILDDFYFANCRCPKCVELKGNRSWSKFRLEQKRRVTEEYVMKTVRDVNPNAHVIIKYPQWYEVYNETGYDLVEEPKLFDFIYTGTETRNPTYAQQHLPKYLSYFIMRYLESAAPGRNLGGWFDEFECTYNLSSYLEQGYLTLFGKAKEVTLYCLGALVDVPEYQTFVPALGQAFREMDAYLGRLGNPVGVVAYRPGNAQGEDNLHNYLGMCGIPFEACIDYPAEAGTVFLTEGAGEDSEIIAKMHESLMRGSDVIVTSGFVRKMGQRFSDTFVNVRYSDRKALVKEYANTKDNGLTVSGKYIGKKEILIPQLDYATNDIWELAAAYGTDNNFPIVLRCRYGKGRISIITVPDDMGDLYHYPAEVFAVIRELFAKDLPVSIEGGAGAMLFLYDNDKMILRSDLPYDETFSLRLHKEAEGVRNLVTGEQIRAVDGRVSLRMMPCVNYVLELI